MQVTLTPELDRMVEHEPTPEWLRREARLGFEQLDAGVLLDITREEFMSQLHERHPR